MHEKLIEKYFKGQCSPEEVREVLDWFAGEAPDAGAEQELYRIWQEQEKENASQAFAPHADRVFANIQAEIDRKAGASVLPGSPAAALVQHPGTALRRRWMAAAVFVPLACLGLLLWYFGSQQSAASLRLTVVAPAGVRKTVYLEDGSRIFLNSDSKIIYPSHFSGRLREVELRGEAFFEVAKDPARPFIVRSGPILTRVVGTSFNIRHRPKESLLAVSLTTGKVTISEGAHKAGQALSRLVPGQQLVYDQAQHSFRVGAFEPSEVLAWRQGILQFKQAGLNQVIDQLAIWYGVDIELSGKGPATTKDWHYTGEFQNQRLEHVLEGIAFVKDFSYEKKGKKVIIRLK